MTAPSGYVQANAPYPQKTGLSLSVLVPRLVTGINPIDISEGQQKFVVTAEDVIRKANVVGQIFIDGQPAMAGGKPCMTNEPCEYSFKAKVEMGPAGPLAGPLRFALRSRVPGDEAVIGQVGPTIWVAAPGYSDQLVKYTFVPYLPKDLMEKLMGQ